MDHQKFDEDLMETFKWSIIKLYPYVYPLSYKTPQLGTNSLDRDYRKDTEVLGASFF